MNDQTKYILLAAALAVAAGGFVQGAPSIKTWFDLFTVQNVFGLFGVWGGVVMAFFTKSPSQSAPNGVSK